MSELLNDKTQHIPSGCGVTGMMNLKGLCVINGKDIVDSITNMKERGNGLGSGYAGYGIYPDMKDYYCFHIMYEKEVAIETTENFLKQRFDIKLKEPIPTKKVKTLKYVPLLYRYFILPKESISFPVLNVYHENTLLSLDDFIIDCVMYVNKNIDGAFVFSSGKNMGIFKGVGEPDEIGEFYRIDEYKAYIWIAHNRFPTNSVAWWGGAHPFGLLNWSVVHNGEISSYGINRRYLENFGYYCTLFTDTEVVTYLVDFIVRKQKLSFDIFAKIIAAPFWSQIDRMPEEEKNFYTKLRAIYGSALVNGPFAVIIATNDKMVGINDRVKLRPLVAAKKDDFLYIASEEAAIRVVCKNLDKVWMPKAGEPVIGEITNNG